MAADVFQGSSHLVFLTLNYTPTTYNETRDTEDLPSLLRAPFLATAEESPSLYFTDTNLSSLGTTLGITKRHLSVEYRCSEYQRINNQQLAVIGGISGLPRQQSFFEGPGNTILLLQIHGSPPTSTTTRGGE